jgi:putative molybdopterin biosynthesis protein
MDGIAITAGPAGAAGVWQLAAASFTWVDTGNPVPVGMDTVVERERVRLHADGSVQITGPAPPGLNVRAAGEDFPAGELLIPAGHRLRPADLATAAAAGHATLTVARRPVAAIIPTGDDPDVIAREIRRAALAADIVLVIAGSSAGRSDHTATVIARTGGLAVRGVAVRPGHPVLLGYVQPEPSPRSRRTGTPMASSWPRRSGADPGRSAG